MINKLKITIITKID